MANVLLSFPNSYKLPNDFPIKGNIVVIYFKLIVTWLNWYIRKKSSSDVEIMNPLHSFSVQKTLKRRSFRSCWCCVLDQSYK